MAPAVQAQVRLDPAVTPDPLETHWKINENAALTFDEARAPSARFSTPTSPSTPEAFWARVTLESAASESTEWILPLAHAEVSATLVRADGRTEEHRTGRRVPLAQRSQPLAEPVAIAVELGPHERAVLYLRVSHPRNSYEISSWRVPQEARAFAQSQRRTNILQGLFIGALLAMLLYNLFLYASLQDRSYLYYVLFLAGNAVFWGATSGHLFELAWPSQVAPFAEVQFYGLILIGLGYALFVRRFLRTWETAPRHDLLLRLCFGAWLVILAMSVLGMWGTVEKLGALNTLLGLGVALSAGIHAYRRGFRPARAYLLAAIWFLLMAAVYVLLFFVAPDLQVAYGRPLLQVATLSEVILLSIALSVRIQVLTAGKAEAEAARQRAEASESAMQQTSALKTKLLGIAAHDLRSPLTGILGFADLIEEEATGQPDVQEMAGVIQRSAQRMLTLVEDLLVTSALDQGHLRLNLQPTDLAALTHATVSDHRPRAEAKNQTLTLDLAESAPLASIDPERCSAILDNLVSNAVKYTPSGGAIDVRFTAGEAFRVAVRDTGPGLSEEDKAALFQPFQTLSPSPTGGEIASGLGLSIAREMAVLHGGRIDVETAEGQGSTFTLVLPLAEPASMPTAAPEAEPQMA